MPYILPAERKRYDAQVNALAESWAQGGCKEGHANYIITRFFWRYLRATQYAKINMVLGVLACVMQELYGRIAKPYERQARRKNGDIL